MKEQRALEILAATGAVITGSHIVYTSGKHGPAYVNKDAVYPHTSAILELCRGIAKEFINDRVQVVVAPAVGGVIISQWVAYHLTEYWRDRRVDHEEILGVYAEHDDVAVFEAKDCEAQIGQVKLSPGEKVFVRRNGFVIKRGYDKLVKDKRVLVVEDILTTGGSVKKVIEAIRALGGEVVGLGAICNRGKVTARDVGNIPRLFSLVNAEMEAYDEDDCPLCRQKIPINTDVGKGRDFLARKK